MCKPNTMSKGPTFVGMGTGVGVGSGALLPDCRRKREHRSQRCKADTHRSNIFTRNSAKTACHSPEYMLEYPLRYKYIENITHLRGEHR
jgi:hypothetical protein